MSFGMAGVGARASVSSSGSGGDAPAPAFDPLNLLILERASQQQYGYLARAPLNYLSEAVSIGPGIIPAYMGAASSAGVFLSTAGSNSHDLTAAKITPVEVASGSYSMTLRHKFVANSQEIVVTIANVATGARYVGVATYTTKWQTNYFTNYHAYLNLSPLDGQGGMISMWFPSGFKLPTDANWDKEIGATSVSTANIPIVAGSSIVAGAIIRPGVSKVTVRGAEMLDGHTAYCQFAVDAYRQGGGRDPIAAIARSGSSYGVGTYECRPFAVSSGDMVVVEFYTQQTGGFTLPVSGAAFFRVEGYNE